METTTTMKATIVAKEEIPSLKFPKEEIFKDAGKHKELQTALERAMKLGNNYKGKVKILFEDNEGLKAVETTIWGVTEKNVILKQTTIIPIRRVHEIRF